MSYNLQSEQYDKKGYGTAALIVGLIPILTFPVVVFIPLLPLALSLLAVILGVLSLNTSRRKSAIAGLVLGVIGFVGTGALILSAMVAFS